MRQCTEEWTVPYLAGLSAVRMTDLAAGNKNDPAMPTWKRTQMASRCPVQLSTDVPPDSSALDGVALRPNGADSQ